MSQRPNILYKYRTWQNECDKFQYQKRILTDNELYLSSADQFNDPFDCALAFRYKESDLTRENLFKKLFENGKKMWPSYSDEQLKKIANERIDYGVFENGRYWKENRDDFHKSVNSTLGIFSLSAVNDNILMWSHYSDSHRGFCVGFDSDKLFKLSGSLGEVIYDDAFPEVGLFDDSMEGFLRLFITKSIDWCYEEEYRILKVNFAKNILTFSNDCVRQIIFGCNIKPEHKEEIMKIAESKYKQAEIFESEINPTEFKLDIKRINN